MFYIASNGYYNSTKEVPIEAVSNDSASLIIKREVRI